jgi:tricorn protease
VPKQLTHYPAVGPLTPRWGWDNTVYGWTPDGAAVLFRSLRDGKNIGDGRLYRVAVAGGLPEALPMPEAGAGDYSPDGARIAYSPLFRDHRSWKRYQGGWAQDLYVFDLATGEAERITSDPRTERDPMWVGGTIFYASDRTGTLNLYAYDLARKTHEPLTASRTFDVRWPAADAAGRIVYELGGELWLYDAGSRESRRIPIQVPTDGLWTRPERVAAGDRIEDFELSPGGERALFVARGDVFTAPIEKGPTRNLTRTPGAHDKWARWSPDGTKIAFISDRSGEDELYLATQDGAGEPRRLTTDGRVMRYQPEWSPDGKRIAVSDKDGKIWVVTLADRSVVEVADDPRGPVRDYTWSPDGAFLAFTLDDPNGFSSVWVWGGADRALRRVTAERFNEFNPAWSADGKYLFYLADRELAPQIGSFEWNYVVDRESYIYALALTRDAPHPFPPESDEVEAGEEKKGEDDAEDADEVKEAKGEKAGKGKKGEEDGEGGDGEKPEQVVVRIDFDGLAERVARVPVEADNYGALTAAPGHLLFVRGAPFYYGRKADVRPALQIFTLEERKTGTVVAGIEGGYALSRDGKKVLVLRDGAYELFDAVADAKDPKKVATDGLAVDRVPREEWAQIFDEVWRRFRDFFYVPNLHGYDWKALGDRYRALLPHVGHRSDLNYLIAEMIAELNVSHAYIEGGDYDLPDRPPVALPGARFAADPASGRYRIARLLAGDNAEDRYRSPLTEIGVDARPGDYLLAIDGEEVRTSDDPYRLLRFKADRPVELTLNDRPAAEGARRVVFEPLASEGDLLYHEWVEGNRRRVEAATGGRVGYLHIPDMGSDGIREFIKNFYGQIRKEGLILDARANGGGNVSPMIIERLSRKLLGIGYARNDDFPETYPPVVFHGSMVALTSETTASDGDLFAAMFRQSGLGPVLGKRTWGGVVGINNRGPLIDGGRVFVPEFGTVSVGGEWVIEGEGVAPDIVVENTPKEVLAGRDPQLERAIEEVLARMAADPKRLPPRPAPPVKTE